ncbi:MAG TPA: double-cubane-cluster-containing anaerobic reductase [Smithellaceae bacterium]|nr:double-cubane-cluster-containing anaerobic reductase [Smithellaceae bacterium]HOM70469.1 double-cubane-cluster-containing anaerobic reductase [Smithellaceae bacterium]HOS08283.1 double-cubane-cluster-containing anaerobic reductase [Smithellaceae bacterium]HOU04051.1 double-cubane-cluster-containing anaerobic reductase [Smithellaceae bacterium]HPD48894.1 double-cubane-cluster-containing anaerobic reductase [Smithellaceae bacterium]
MKADVDPLVNDGFAGEPAKRCLSYIQSQREKGKNVVGIYCGYAPMEVIRAAGMVPAVLCAFADKAIAAGEEVLPTNLCPLIKSSYGFIRTDTCPFYALSQAVIAETTCDGKKKMFELIADIKPTHVMDLPQLPDQKEAQDNWTVMIRKLAGFLEQTFECKVSDAAVEEEIKNTNLKNKLLNQIFDFAALTPSPITWQEIYDLTYLGQVATTEDMLPMLKDCLVKLEKRVADGVYHGEKHSPRVLVTGCPVGGDATKVFKIIEDAGGVIVYLDACTGMKAYEGQFEENAQNPYRSVSRRYLNVPCSCMTPNTRRMTELDLIIDKFQPDVVVDVVLHACHSYNVESSRVKAHVEEKHKKPFLKIETDYSQSDVGQIRTRVEALLEMVRK